MRSMFGVFTFASIVALAATPRAFADVSSGVTGGVTGLLARSARAWNHGDLATFMRSYEDSPETVYISSTSVIHGYAAIRAHYAAHYGPSGMGELSFSELTVRPLGADYAVAFARWHLALPSGAHPTGLFSLVLHRSAGAWHIIADHSP
jgi:ketosteroid isomerase-like protein